MDFRILGSVEVLAEGQPLPIGGPKQRALLAYLLLNGYEAVSAERLIEELWYDPPSGGTQTVQTQVSRLKRALGGRVTWCGSGYAIELEPQELDLDRFRSLLAQAGTERDPAQRSKLLNEADALWHGTPLQGVEGPFVAAEVRALEELRVAALEERIEADLEAGRHAVVASELSSLVSRYPLRERLRGQLILALYRGGRQAEALAAYREARRMLDEELGIEPSPALRDLELAILRHDPTLDLRPSARAALMPEATPERTPRRRQAGLVLVAIVAVGALATAGFALTRGNPGHTQAAPPLVQTIIRPTTGIRRATVRHVRVHKIVPRRRSTIEPVERKTTKPPTSAPSATTQEEATTVKAAPAASTTTPKTSTRKPHKPATTSTPTVRRQLAPPATPVTISDTFAGDFLDPAMWHQVTTDDNVSISEQDGQLLVTVGAAAVRGGAYNQIDVHAGTQCSFPGDFDAYVDYKLLEWPAADNIFIGLNAIYAGSTVGRENNSVWGDEYAAWVVPGTNGSVPLTDESGSLRITRRKGIATDYFWHNGAWTRMASGHSSGAAVFGLGAMSAGATSAFGQQELRVAFDNFRATGVQPTCPPGSRQPTS